MALLCLDGFSPPARSLDFNESCESSFLLLLTSSSIASMRASSTVAWPGCEPHGSEREVVVTLVVALVVTVCTKGPDLTAGASSRGAIASEAHGEPGLFFETSAPEGAGHYLVCNSSRQT